MVRPSKETDLKRLMLVLAFAAAAAVADEGMWMPQQVPQLADQLKKQGLKIDPNRFADLTGDLMGAVVSLGGCTASFVSPEGLVVTNHHCAYGSIQYNSTKDRDLIANGFVAHTRAEELPAAPGQRLWVTTRIDDVTPRVTGNLPAKLSDADRERAIDRRIKQLIAECEKAGGVRCKIGAFFETYQMVTQQELADVRLVYAPPSAIGEFGGEIDNFEWPRHTGDFAFFRGYVDGRPYRPKSWLKVSTEGVNEGDLVVVAGYPGRTFRYKTAAETQWYRDFQYPVSIRYYGEMIRILQEAGKGDRTIQIRNASRVKSLANSLKNYTSVAEGFAKDKIVESRLEREAKMRANGAGAVLDELARLHAGVEKTNERDLLLTWLIGYAGGSGFTYRSSPMLTQAYQISRLANERPKKDPERQTGYQQRDVDAIRAASDRAQRVIDLGSDRAGLRYFLGEVAKLPSTQRIEAIDRAVAAADGIEPLLDRLYGNTKVHDQEERTKMLSESAAELRKRGDAMLDFAASLLPLAEQVETAELAYSGAQSRLRPAYFEALRRVSGGGPLYPDANGTLRVTFGRVEGYTVRDATWFTPQTTLAGVLAKEKGEEPFANPPALLEAARAGRTAGYLDPQLRDVPVNFLSTCDTTGGNSGSPTLNAKGELNGLLFDGNYESIDADFLFTPAITRSIHVDSVYMLWVMDAVDRAHELLQEMGVKPRY